MYLTYLKKKFGDFRQIAPIAPIAPNFLRAKICPNKVIKKHFTVKKVLD